jgi:hypothetical protein
LQVVEQQSSSVEQLLPVGSQTHEPLLVQYPSQQSASVEQASVWPPQLDEAQTPAVVLHVPKQQSSDVEQEPSVSSQPQ